MNKEKSLNTPSLHVNDLLFRGLNNLGLGSKVIVVRDGCEPSKAQSKEIKGIYANEVKKTVAVVLKDGTTKVAKCSPEDSFDLEVGFALAFTRAYFGGKKKTKEIIRKAKVVKKPLAEQAKTAKLVTPKQTTKRRGRKPAGQATETAKRGRKPRKAKKQEE